jgi:hypothetical protein
MKISIRTFSDSGNEFLHSLRKSLNPLEGFLTRYFCSFRPLNLNFFNYVHRVDLKG